MTLDEAVLEVLQTNRLWWLSQDVLNEVIRRELYFQKSGNNPTQEQVVKRLLKQEEKGHVEVNRENSRQFLYKLRSQS